MISIFTDIFKTKQISCFVSPLFRFWQGNSVGNSTHDHVHVHAHGFGTISHSLQGMVRIQLDETSDFSSKAHYFVQLLEDMILTLNI